MRLVVEPFLSLRQKVFRAPRDGASQIVTRPTPESRVWKLLFYDSERPEAGVYDGPVSGGPAPSPPNELTLKSVFPAGLARRRDKGELLMVEYHKSSPALVPPAH
jgi:hypothetical protein